MEDVKALSARCPLEHCALSGIELTLEGYPLPKLLTFRRRCQGSYR